MVVASYSEVHIPPGVRVQVQALQQQAWPGPTGGHDLALHPVTMVLRIGETVVAALDVLSKDIEHRGARYRVSGLSAVVTDRRRRRNGYGARLVSVARELIAESGADLSMFTCERPLAGFYTGAGFRVLSSAVLVGSTPDDPLPSDTAGFDKVTMGAFFSDLARRNARDFEHVRIELFPGSIDRLW